MLMFGNVFYIIGHRYDEEDEHAADDDGGEPEPFSTAQEAFLSLYRMMLGDSDRSWFSSEVATFFFFLSTQSLFPPFLSFIHSLPHTRSYISFSSSLLPTAPQTTGA